MITPEYKAECKAILAETDYSVLPDVAITPYCLELFIAYRLVVRNELIGKTSYYSEGALPPIPEAVWKDLP